MMQQTHVTDEVLIQQALLGRQSAYSMLVKRYERYVFTLSLRFVKEREDAHEVAQDSFLKAFKYLVDFRGECKFSTWLYKIVYSTALNFLRKNRPEILSLDDDLRPIKIKDNTTSSASANLELDERNAILQQAIAYLSPDDAGILTLFYLYEQKLEEICEVMELTMSNAKTKLCRARQRLRTVIEEKFVDLR